MNRRRVLLLPFSLLLPALPAQAASGRLGIIFVGQSSCPYCLAIAPILKQLQEAGSADVLVASMDMAAIPPFAAFEDGRAHPLTARFQTVPQVMIYHPGRDRVTHVVGGVRNLRHFVRRLSFALREASAL